MDFVQFKDGSLLVRPCAEVPQGAKIIVPNTAEGAKEKHLPVATVEDGKVNVVVGSVEHPMSAEHYIQLILLETSAGAKYEKLLPMEAPKATFALAEGETPIAVYAICNLHGLWMTQL